MTADDDGLGALRLRDYQRDAVAAVHRAWAGEQRGTGVGVANRVAVVRVVPRHSPYPTDGPVDLDILGHIMPVRLGDER